MATKTKLNRNADGQRRLGAPNVHRELPVDENQVANSSPVQPQLLSRINEAFVLRSIRQHGPSTRGELSQHMGVTFPTVAKAVGSLLDARLLEEFDHVL